MPTGPLTRARHLRSILDQARELSEPSRSKVLDAFGAGQAQRVDDAAGTDWLPFQLDLDLTHAIEAALGPEGKHAFFLRHQLASFQSPLFKTLVDSATTIFGLDPGSWARWIPRGWGVVFRECGQWVIDRSAPGAVDLALVAPPPGSLDDEVWLHSLASSFSSFLVVARCEGEFALDRVDRARDAALYRLRWTKG